MKEIITIIGIFLFACVLVGAMTFGLINSPHQTPEQRKADAYYYCVRVQAVNHLDIDNCNKIK